MNSRYIVDVWDNNRMYRDPILRSCAGGVWGWGFGLGRRGPGGLFGLMW